MAEVMPPVQSVSLSSPGPAVLKPVDHLTQIAMCIINICEFCRSADPSMPRRSGSSAPHAHMKHGRTWQGRPCARLMRFCCSEARLLVSSSSSQSVVSSHHCIKICIDHTKTRCNCSLETVILAVAGKSGLDSGSQLCGQGLWLGFVVQLLLGAPGRAPSGPHRARLAVWGCSARH